MLKKNIIPILLFLIIGLLAFYILDKSNKVTVSNFVVENLNSLKFMYQNNKLLTIFFFCVAHLISSTLSIPGSCTLLNVLSGAIFGFWKGCLIVYLITALGALVGYFLGRKLPLSFIRLKYEKKINYLRTYLSGSNFLLLIILRLSPLLPFGIINIILGFLNIPLSIYFVTTVIGIFFDVVILNSIGAMISGASAFNATDKWTISLVFLTIILLYCVKMFKSKIKSDFNVEIKN